MIIMAIECPRKGGAVYLLLKWRQSRTTTPLPAVVVPPETDVGAPEMAPMPTSSVSGRVAVK
jgi:hypothetical protein